ncbi:hypothetical protein CLG96_05875 [Sphingomonas oleivorans]|uniref:Cthe-2314-like HEPN domain-containing protein n=2 Tax=Sphingomonas oleivorans TaxID=1735121 RepID=A0A2T5FZI6_9SPHN|nr:hypothetical protein CLG96_05875 [Sphingomonas oleivorans]
MIINRFAEFDERYRFHRALADAAYHRPMPSDEDGAEAGTDRTKRLGASLTSRINARLSADREGFFHSTAMIDAYFSSLEHRLVLLRVFTGRPFAEGDMLALLGMKWGDKLKTVLTAPFSNETSDILGRMRRIKERIRNPFAHGGVENDNGSLFFRLPSIGAVPANFSQFGQSVRFSMLPVDAEGHAESCETFDALDQLLSTGALAGPDQFMRGGVDPVFDAEHCAEYAEAIAEGPVGIDAYIDGWSDQWERHVNMDY